MRLVVNESFHSWINDLRQRWFTSAQTEHEFSLWAIAASGLNGHVEIAQFVANLRDVFRRDVKVVGKPQVLGSG